MQLNTARLGLRPVIAGDLDHLVTLDADPLVMRYVSGGAATSAETIAGWVIPRMQLQQHDYGTGMWLMFDDAQRSTRFAGWIQLRTPRHSGGGELELSYRLPRRAWGRGYAREGASALIAAMFTRQADQWPAIGRVFAGTHIDHRASRRVLEALGMRLAADTDVTAFGEPGAGIEYEILREHWAGGRTRRSRASGVHPAGWDSGMTA